jgi:hypothetical protein
LEEAQMDQTGGLSPKITPLPGSLQWEWRRCAKPNCWCAAGERGHGPYLYHYWYEDGRRHKQYVPRRRLPGVAAALAAYRALHPSLWTMRQELAALRRLEQEITA